MIVMDFILALSKALSGEDTLLTITCKFSKKVTLIPGLETWTARDWGKAIVLRLIDMDWGIPKAIISDRDPKFLSELWAGLFHELGTKLLYAAAYHPQSDGQSERTNQTVESALRYYLHAMEDPRKWLSILPRLQFGLNNLYSESIKRSPNEAAYGFTPNDVINLITDSRDVHKALDLPMAWLEISDAIAESAMTIKRYYDQGRKPIFFSVGDKVYLRLHRGYSIPSATNRKLGLQRAGPFEIIEPIGRLAYRLRIPDHWRVHNVFAIDHLEPATPGDDPFLRSRPDLPGPVYVEGDTEYSKSYEIERLVDKHVTPTGRVKYLL